MLKRLRIYYFYVALPFAAMLAGAAFYYDLIAKTITANPHPQINYAIFAIILLGGFLILQSVHRLMQEASALAKYSDAVRSGADATALQEMAINIDVDIAYTLRMLAASTGRSITHQEQIAIDHELEKAASRLNSRMALPQFLSGLLVGMGLLGTFVGLLATLNDISALISSFADIDMSHANPIDVFRTMIERMKAPMQSMGIAFSASLFGLLGSIILGFMMVGIRRCMGDIVSILGSEVAQHIEFALANEGFAYSKGALKQGLGRPHDSAAGFDLLARASLAPIDRQAAPAGDASEPSMATLSAEQASTPAASTVDAESRANEAVAQLGDFDGEELRVLMRIESRLAETSRLQQRALTADMDDFQKQRGDMLRSISEHSDAVTNFRGELQRVGRQLGTILGIMEKGNGEVLAQLSELMVRMSDDAAESRKLMIIQIEGQRRSGEAMNALAQATSRAVGG
jgi:hypothetical protein